MEFTWKFNSKPCFFHFGKQVIHTVFWSSTASLSLKTGMISTFKRGFLAGGREQREAPSWQAPTSGHFSQLGTERHLLFQKFILGWLADLPPRLHHTREASNLKTKYHQVASSLVIRLPRQKHGGFAAQAMPELASCGTTGSTAQPKECAAVALPRRSKCTATIPQNEQ